MQILKKISWIVISSFLLMFFGSTSVLAECEKSVINAKETLSRVSKRYSQVDSLTANFEQSSFFLGLGDSVQSSGKLSFKRPGRMDWSYQLPQPQRFVADGEKVWFYQPDLNQVTVGAFKKAFSSNIPVTFLLGVGELANSFELAKSCDSDKGYEFFLNPKVEDPNLKKFILLVDKTTLIPSGAKITDVGGNETAITLKNVNTSVVLSDSDFAFVIPKGVDVIDQSKLMMPEVAK